MHLPIGQQIPGVRLLEAQVKGRHIPVPPGEIHPRDQLVVIHLKTGNPFHIRTPFINGTYSPSLSALAKGSTTALSFAIRVVLPAQPVRDRLQRRKLYPVPQAHLRHSAALHLAERRREGLSHPVRPLAAAHEHIPRSHPAHQMLHPLGSENGAEPLRLIRREHHLIYRGHHPNGVPGGGRIHVVLDKVTRQNHRSDRQVQKTPRHPGIDDPVRVIPVDKELRPHRGVHLPHSAGKGEDIRLDLVDVHAAGRLQPLGLGMIQNALDLALQGVRKSDFHGLSSSFCNCLHYSTAHSFGKV